MATFFIVTIVRTSNPIGALDFINQLSGIFSVFLSLPQWDIKIPWTFQFVIAAFNFIIVAPFLKLSISTVCHYKIMKQKVAERLIITVQV
jgi:hypothetical protein